VENEHVCLALARALGLPVASSRVRRFEGEVALVIERYDRQRAGNEILRVHQEDAGQALGVMPAIKYQNQGGPGVADVFELLNAQSAKREEDTMTFLRAVGFNWLIGGNDAHARNHSLLIAHGPRVRLAPLYDLTSILPYDEFDPHAARLAMQIGGEYQVSRIGSRQWQKLARELRLDGDAVIDELRRMAATLPDAVSAVVAQARRDGLAHAILDRLSAQLIERVKA
jgi:serine/threonine-protein kinase HipA